MTLFSESTDQGEQLTAYRTRLEAMVEARTEELMRKNLELEETNVRLQEIDRLKSVFLATMSHELRTPLNSIIGCTGIMLQGMAGELNQEQKKQLSIVKSNASHLLNLINDILDISKIEAGKVELSLSEFKLDDMVQDVVQALATMAKQKNLELATEVPKNVTLFSDRGRMTQVLTNLVSNAIKFTDRGTAKVAARVFDGHRLELSVSDTGIGIKQEDMPNLFQPFRQLAVSPTKRYEGTGLGLHLSKKLSDLLGGSIRVKSQYGSGSEFTFSVPLVYDGNLNPVASGEKS